MKRISTILIVIAAIVCVLYICIRESAASDLPPSLLLSGINYREVETSMMDEFKKGFPEETRSIIDTSDHSLNYIHTDINNDGKKDFVVTLNSKFTCGSGGCLTKIFIQDEHKQFQPLNFSYAVKGISVLSSYTNNMRDLRVNNDTASRMSWNGSSYVLETI